MRHRYPHYIERETRPLTHPAYVCVHFEHGCPSGSGDDGPPLAGHIKWECRLLEYELDKYYCTWTGTGCSVESWWHTLSTILRDTNEVSVVSYNCAQQWPLCKLYDAIESRAISLIGRDKGDGKHDGDMVQEVRKDNVIVYQSDNGKNLHGVRSGQSGWMILESPPCAAKLFVCDADAWVTWLDVQNFGVTLPIAESGPSQRCANIADWLLSVNEINYRLGLGDLQVSAGAQAMHGWRRSYLSHGVYCHVSKPAAALESKGYYGGRCEAYRIGTTETNVYHLDVRSLYPSVCIGANLPVRLHAAIADCTDTYNQFVAGRFNQIATVSIETDEPAYPLRREWDTIYPVGRFKTTLCGPELEDAFTRGRICQIHESATYEMESALDRYMRILYEERAKAATSDVSGVQSYIKKLLVCLPGKFAQINRNWTYAPDVWSDEQWGEFWGQDKDGTPVRYRSLGGIVYRDCTGGIAYDSVPSISAWVTSLGRMRLLHLIRVAGWSNVIYCDTDSLICNEVGYELLRNNHQVKTGAIGFLQEIGGPGNCVLHGIKSYTFGSSTVCAGMPRGTIEDVGDGVHYWHTVAPIDEVTKQRRPTGERRLLIYDDAKKYRHGSVKTDGTVMPFELAEW